MTDPRTLDAALRSDFHTFARKAFNTLHPAGGFEPNWHLEAVTHRLEQVRLGHEKRLIINVPPRSLKSLLASVALPAFILGHDPGARLICVSYAQALAGKLSRDSAGYSKRIGIRGFSRARWWPRTPKISSKPLLAGRDCRPRLAPW